MKRLKRRLSLGIALLLMLTLSLSSLVMAASTDEPKLNNEPTTSDTNCGYYCGTIFINKYISVASEGSPHSGITFELWKDGTLFQTGVTNEYGVLVFTDLPFGTYTLKEITLPGFTTNLAEDTTIEVGYYPYESTIINTPILNVKNACVVNPEKREWIVTNESNIDVPFEWTIIGTEQQGEGIVPKNSSVPITTNSTNGPVKIAISWESEQQITLDSNDVPCPTELTNTCSFTYT